MQPDPATPTEPVAVASQPGPAAPAAFDPSALSPEAIAWIDGEKRRASDAAAAAARREVTGKARPAASAPAPQPSAPVGDDAASLLALRDAFDDAIGDMPIRSAQKSLVREAVMRDRPQDVAGYVGRFAERAGWNSTAPAVPQPAAPAAPAQPIPPAIPATHRAPPPPTPTESDATPIHLRSIPEREALVARIGHEEFAKRLMVELRNVRVPLS